jgi:hypothetical protein
MALATAESVMRAEKEPMVVQTLIFSKDKFDVEKAKKWCSEHGFGMHKAPDVTTNSIRIRQKDPSEFKAGTFKTWPITDGIMAVGGKLK